MADLCADNRFNLIEKYKKKLIEATNIETSTEEIKVLDNILFRFWQMGWLEKLEQPQAEIVRCKDCKRWRQQTNYQGVPLSFGFCESDDMWTYTECDHYCGYAERIS